MLKVVSLDNIDKIEDYDIIVPSNSELYYKNKYVNKNYRINTFRNFVLKKYNGNKKLANGNEKYLIMYEVVKDISHDLNVYKDFITYDFINDLLDTYDKFYDYELNDNDKILDLKKLFKSYEEKLLEKNLISEKLMFSDVISNTLFNEKYLFLDFAIPSKEELKLINKMNDDGLVLLVLDNINNGYIKKVLKDLDVNLSTNDDFDLSSKNVYFKALNDVSEEVSFVSNDVSKKIMEGYCYDDFMIVCNKQIYLPYIDLLFNHPYSKTNFDGVLTSRFIRILTDILNGDFSCEKFINLLKLNLFDIDLKRIDDLDNYIYGFDLAKESFYLPFKYNPSGNKKYFSSNDEILLKELNDIKDDVINPIRYLLENVINETNKTNLLKFLYTYLKEEVIDELFIKDEVGCNTLISALEDINSYLGEETTLNEIINILNKICIQNIKQNINQDEVLVADLNSFDCHDKKFIYFLGATSDEVPKEFSINSLINNNDINKKCLISEIENNNFKWYYLFSKLVNNENVTITYPKLGTDLKLKEVCDYVKCLELIDINDNTIYDKNIMINDYAISLSEDKLNHFYNDEFTNINNSNKHDLNKKITSVAAHELYTDNLVLSPSSIETYSKCPFYHFCQYGLNLKVKEKYTFDNRELGTFVHYVLQKIISSDLDKININNIDDYINKYALNYLEDNGKIVNKKVKFVLERLSKSTKLVIENIIKEQCVSSFKPRYFELKIDENSIIKPLHIKLDNGSLTVNGIADRIDVYEDDKNYYYRIIDYKTGDKKFRLDEVLNGLNLQMLLYVLAIKESNNLTKKSIVPSGLLYYPALVKEQLASRSFSLEEKELMVSKILRMNGIINYDDKVLEAFGKEKIDKFTSVMSRDKLSLDKIFGIDDLNLIFDNVKATLKKIGNDILSGNIAVSPLDMTESACTYCKFNSICKFDSSKNKKRKGNVYKNSEVLNMLRSDNNAKLD